MAATRQFDVIVVGGGNAALCAALAAHQCGANVAVLEAAPIEERGGNSRFASALFRFVHSGMQDIEPLLPPSEEANVKRCTIAPYTREDYAADMLSTSRGQCDMEKIEVLFDKGLETLTWLRDQGVKWRIPVNKFFDLDKIMTGTIKIPAGSPVGAQNEGISLTDDLWEAVEKAGISTFYGCPAYDLITNGDTILGVRTRQRDRYVDFEGQVILACGGFEASARLRRQYLGDPWDLVVVRGCRFNMGTMLEKAIAAGAANAGHWGGCHASPQDLNAPKVGDLSLTDKMSRYSYPYSVMVNIEGKRFLDEGEDNFVLTYAKTGGAISQQPGATAYQIFDQKTIHLLEPRYSTGKPITDDTLEGLAKKIGVNVPQFLATVNKFNDAVPKHGAFDPFKNDGLCTSGLSIPKSNWAIPIDKPPFVAYGVTGGK